MSTGWYYMHAQSAAWWDRGQQSWCFRKEGQGKNGGLMLAFRSLPNPKKLENVMGVWDPVDGWQDHPAAKAAKEHFQFPGVT